MRWLTLCRFARVFVHREFSGIERQIPAKRLMNSYQPRARPRFGVGVFRFQINALGRLSQRAPELFSAVNSKCWYRESAGTTISTYFPPPVITEKTDVTTW